MRTFYDDFLQNWIVQPISNYGNTLTGGEPLNHSVSSFASDINQHILIPIAQPVVAPTAALAKTILNPVPNREEYESLDSNPATENNTATSSISSTCPTEDETEEKYEPLDDDTVINRTSSTSSIFASLSDCFGRPMRLQATLHSIMASTTAGIAHNFSVAGLLGKERGVPPQREEMQSLNPHAQSTYSP